MKKIKYTLLMTFLLAAVFYPSLEVNANWMKKEIKSSPEGYQSIQSAESSGTEKKDSLPEGVTQDWLNSLLDENGNRIINESKSGTSGEIPEDPEGDAMQRKIFNGQAANNNFGTSVSSAGDVNGDGYDDIIVGAYGYNSNTGRAYIYFGGLIMNTAADVIITGNANGDRLGISVSSAGDVNGDGYSDVIVGEYGFSSDMGRAYIFFGGASMNNSADVTMTGEAAGNFFGYSVSSAGDVNGDGYSDVIVGAYEYSSSAGRAYVFFGGAGMDNAADATMTGEAALNDFGYSVSSAGDVNGDGYSDVIVGARDFSSVTGRAYVFFGGAGMDSTADVIMTGEAAGSHFGVSVSTAGDVNGDGYSDVIVGASRYSSFTGRAYVFFGGAGMDNAADVIMTGEATSNFFGLSVSSAGDINGDGYSDVIVGAFGYSSSAGRAYVFFGGGSMNNIADVTMTGEVSNGYFGWSVSTAGDVNGDGYSDVLVGAYRYSSFTGRVYLYDYFMKNEIVPDVKMTGEGSGNEFGYSVSSAGDVNGDGYSDVIVGAYLYSGSAGRAYLFFGGAGMDNVADVIITGEAGSNYFGSSVSSAGDVNGDGYSDVIVGAYRYSSYTGRAYVFFGGAGMDNAADVTMTGEATYNVFGISVSTAGDVNGDGYSDVIVGAYLYSGFKGRAYVFFGGAGMNSTADVTMTGEIIDNYFGKSVSSAGDVNGDGYTDVIVGADGYSSNTGRAYVFFGGAGMDNAADVIMTGEGTSNYFGISVSTAGDVNGDGYSDVIVGADGYSSNTGRSYIYFGAWSMDSIADVTMTGEITNNYFGKSLSSAGDVNGDGYSDLITGANVYSSFTGSSYIYLGSAISAKPILNYVKDVPNDQGGYVNIKWARSSYDVNSNDLITDYIVYRSYPPSGGQFSWEVRSVIPARKRSFYTFTDNTPSDSSTGGNGTMYYQIMARTYSPSNYWLSGILYGRSIDNIAPTMVTLFTAAASGPDVRLNWNRNTAPDLLNYVLFRNVNPTIDPNTETPWGTATDTTLLDTAPLSGLYYYFIVAQDIHGNYSPVSSAQSPVTILDLSVFIEAFYNSGSNTQISDTVTVQLRNPAFPFAVAVEVKGLVASDGTMQLIFNNTANGNYYITVIHRNSIETWSAAPVSITSDSTNIYDFSTVSSQAYGSNQLQLDAAPVRYGVYSGDVNQDGTIDLTDGSLIDNDAFNFVSGYVPTDVNGDGVVDLADAVFADNNGFNFVSKITP